jgi:hypothetical protein
LPTSKVLLLVGVTFVAGLAGFPWTSENTLTARHR